jgi:hypothetical protein
MLADAYLYLTRIFKCIMTEGLVCSSGVNKEKYFGFDKKKLTIIYLKDFQKEHV